MLQNCLEEDVCLYRHNAWWGGEDHSWRTAENSWVLGSKNLIYLKLSNSTYITTCCLGGFQEKKSPSSYKNKLQDIQLSDTTGSSNGTGFYGQMKLKTLAFYQQTLKMGLVNTGIKKYLMCTIKYTAVFLMLWVYISAWGPGHLV